MFPPELLNVPTLKQALVANSSDLFSPTHKHSGPVNAKQQVMLGLANGENLQMYPHQASLLA